MITVEIEDKPIKVRFSHTGPEETIRHTLCYLVQDESTVSTGVARCAAGDQFCRQRGRKIALARALSRFDKDIRKRVWEAYFAKLGKFA